MANVLRFKSLWTGFTGAPGYTVFHVAEDTTDPVQVSSWANNILTFWQAIKGVLPSDVTISISTDVDVVDIESGNLVGKQTAPSLTDVLGTSVSGYSAASGMVINWSTGVYSSGRLVRGRTFLVPAAGVFFTDGTPRADMITTVQDAAVAMVDAEPKPLAIYSRPTAKRPIGALNAVTAVNVPDLAAILTSRRD